jgi:hypothetical protein
VANANDGRMLAFHSDPALKEEYLARVEAHRRADEIVQGYGYWIGGKGCGVGCTIHGQDHSRYETELGIPSALARLEDAIFEGLPNPDAMDFPSKFLGSIPVGADLSMVAPKFTHWLLTSPEIGLAGKADGAGKSAIATVAGLYDRWVAGDNPPEPEWHAARVAAGNAAWAAGRDAAAVAAWEAAGVWPMAGAAARAAAGAAGRDAAAVAAWVAMARKLLELLAESPVPGPGDGE